ncbi:E3 ubiquitin-protein ligase rnf213-alpha [Dissostichus eleginoides]|uniref:E3 ubiquitin-protein ligase rnf213-alpha n=1 Tax=Dissostichus eleginoides TaxID=100907 RepID=A0AAD9CMJ8_DISEL|nr:E3 ubiquitin-protein ligase rnf213-alpha [Dissostichus eleginoides]
MPPKAGRGRRKKLAERSPEGSRSPQQSQESLQHSPSPPLPRNRHPESSDDEGKSKSKPKVGKGDKGKGKAQKENPPPGASYSFTEAQEEAIARWAAEYGLDYHSILKWYHTQRTQFLKLREGQPKKKSQKRSGDGLSSGYEEDPILAEEASENDSDRDKFIRRVFGFLKPHIRRHKKDTPASLTDGPEVNGHCWVLAAHLGAFLLLLDPLQFSLELGHINGDKSADGVKARAKAACRRNATAVCCCEASDLAVRVCRLGTYLRGRKG